MATPIVRETADWWPNDVYKSALTGKNVQQAFANALTQEEVQEGQCGRWSGDDMP
jgi:L-aminopeptidase/D-esterase-like protein